MCFVLWPKKTEEEEERNVVQSLVAVVVDVLQAESRREEEQKLVGSIVTVGAATPELRHCIEMGIFCCCSNLEWW